MWAGDRRRRLKNQLSALLSCACSPHQIHQLQFLLWLSGHVRRIYWSTASDWWLLTGFEERKKEIKKKKSEGVIMALRQLWNDQLTINLAVVTIADSLYWPDSTRLCEVILHWLTDILSRWVGSCSWKLFFFPPLVRSGNNLYGDFLVAWMYRNIKSNVYAYYFCSDEMRS